MSGANTSVIGGSVVPRFEGAARDFAVALSLGHVAVASWNVTAQFAGSVAGVCRLDLTHAECPHRAYRASPPVATERRGDSAASVKERGRVKVDAVILWVI
jgi:hypothetical protein